MVNTGVFECEQSSSQDFCDIPSLSLSNGVELPLLGLGTTHSGGYYHDTVLHALRKCKYRLIDTAKRYGVERELGIAIESCGIPRSSLFVSSKLWPVDFGRATFDAYRLSCEKLRADYLDLYMLHFPDVPDWFGDARQTREDTWRCMERMYEAGLVRSIGVSNFSPSDLYELEEHASVMPHVNQCEYHPWFQNAEVRTACAEVGTTFTGYCPLAKGKYLDDPRLTGIAERHGKTPAQICLRWSIENGVPAIPKSKSISRIEENCQIFDFSLTSEDHEVLSTLKYPPKKIVNTTGLMDKINLPDGYKLDGRVFGVPGRGSEGRGLSRCQPTGHMQGHSVPRVC